jgi:hypothetical protein
LATDARSRSGVRPPSTRLRAGSRSGDRLR